MRLFVMILTILVLPGLVSAECRQKDCMPNERIVTNSDEVGMGAPGAFSMYYDNVFEIGSNWFVIFEYGEAYANGSLEFDFGYGLTKNLTLQYDEGIVVDSVSFSGSIFSDEEPHKRMYVNFSNEDGPAWSVELDIFVNQPPANDLFYLWGGMTVFWASIGAYVLYISSKFTQLREK